MTFTVIFSWMKSLIPDKKLNLSEVVTYATIYNFSKDGQGVFKGTYEYISSLTQLERRQQIRVVKKLVELKLILKALSQDGYSNEYRVNLDMIPTEVKYSNLKTHRKEGGCQNVTGGDISNIYIHKNENEDKETKGNTKEYKNISNINNELFDTNVSHNSMRAMRSPVREMRNSDSSSYQKVEVKKGGQIV